VGIVRLVGLVVCGFRVFGVLDYDATTPKQTAQIDHFK